MTQHIFDLHPSPDDPRDFLMEFSPALALPDAALLPKIPAIKDQGQEGSCTGFSLSSAREALDRQTIGVAYSPAFIYYRERVIERDTDRDAGAAIRDGLAVLAKQGVCTEARFPYVAGQFAQAPPPEAVTDARTHRIASYHRLRSVHAAKAALVAALPVVFGMAVYSGMEASRDGTIPMPDATQAMLGGHAILAVGYRDDAAAPGGGHFILNNSWGASAGTSGQYFLPYAYWQATDWFEGWTLAA